MKRTLTKVSKTSKEDNKLIWKIHHWAGFYAGIVIAVLCLTGSVAVFIPEIDYLIQKMHYSASSTAAEEWHFERSLNKLSLKYPGYQLLRIEFPDKPGHAGIIQINRLAFFVDMGRDELLGSRNAQNSVANYLRQIHVRLYEGYWGRYFVGLAGICFVVVTITGLMIYGKFMKRQRFPEVRKERGLRIILADWHKLLGIAALAFNLVIAITGAWLGLQGWFKVKNPAQFKAPIHMDEAADLKVTINWQDAFRSSAKNFPDLLLRYAVPSGDGSGTISFFGNIKGQIYERNINRLVLSKTSLEPLYKYDVREKPFWHKFYFVQEALHFGDYGGIALKILYAALGLVASFLSISGFIIYFFRTEKKAKRKTSPMKITFLYSVLIILLLLVVALVSTLIGYSTAAYIMAIVIDGGLLVLIVYFIAKYFLGKFRKIKVTTI